MYVVVLFILFIVNVVVFLVRVMLDAIVI